MSNVHLSPRDLSLMRLLSWTPATAKMLHRASDSFEDGPFLDERRLRERLQALASSGFVRSWSLAQANGGVQKYFKLAPAGFTRLHGIEAKQPPRAYFGEVSPSLVVHTFRLAETIVEMTRACSFRRVAIVRFARENEIAFRAGDRQVQPDCFFRLSLAGKFFNLAFEIDNSTASVDANASNAIRQKLITYEAAQDAFLASWRNAGRNAEKPRFRVIFLTPTVERAYHILSLAAELTRARHRHLVYAAPFESFVSDPDPLMSPILLDHTGRWHSLVDLHPTATSPRPPVRLPRIVAPAFAFC